MRPTYKKPLVPRPAASQDWTSHSQGTGLQAQYFANPGLAGAPVLQRVEAVDFDWGTATPGPGVPADGFSARWSGVVVAPATGLYRLKTRSDDGVRLWWDYEQVINHWGIHAPADDISPPRFLVAGQAVPITVEYFEADRGATLRLQWQPPGAADFSAIPARHLFAR